MPLNLTGIDIYMKDATGSFLKLGEAFSSGAKVMQSIAQDLPPVIHMEGWGEKSSADTESIPEQAEPEKKLEWETPFAYKTKVEGADYIVHSLPLQQGTIPITANDLLKAQLSHSGMPMVRITDQGCNYAEAVPYTEAIAEALLKSELLDVDLKYAYSLLEGMMASMRALKTACHSEDKEAIEKALKGMDNAVKCGKDFCSAMDSSNKHWRKKAWIKKGKSTTITLNEPKKSYVDGEWKYPDNIEMVYLIRNPLNGNWSSGV